jgi:hypothetical protein
MIEDQYKSKEEFLDKTIKLLDEIILELDLQEFLFKDLLEKNESNTTNE